ncbi:MAG TPA: tol-pal system protein YbgF [Ramlibacter sp.]|nr:tol-pal system protein YbgF [Ramlibacter sp.]
MRLRSTIAHLVAAGALLAPLAGHAQLFGGDDEARRAILDLRQRLDAQRQFSERQMAEIQSLRRAVEETDQLRRGILELSNQIESLRTELARMRGQDEQLARDIAEVQRRQRDLAQAITQSSQTVEERLKRFEPAKVQVDGLEFTADPAEQREFDAALAVFRRGDFPAAQTAFDNFLRRWPQSGYRPSALFWLGNAQYAVRDYRTALANFRALIQQAPDHPRAPEAVLSIANCQIELKDNAAARRTLDDLVKAYPQSEAAVAARERLARFR